MSQLTLEAVCAQAAGVSVLESITFSIDPGEAVAVIGPRNCGKQSLLRVVAGLLPASSGRIILGGRDITTVVPDQRPLSMVRPRDAEPNRISVAAYLGMAPRRGQPAAPADAAQARKLMALLDLGRHADQPLASVGPALYRRIALARALASAPDVLLLDESAEWDCLNARAQWRAAFRDVRRKLRQTTLMVTADAESAISMADRLVVMDGAQVRQTGAVSDIYNFPSDAFVACSVGRCNLVPGEYTGPGQFRSSSGLELPCAHVDPQPAGPAVLAIRPENVELGPPMGGLRARVTDVTFLGSQIEYGLDMYGHPLSAVASTRTSGVPPLQPGASVDLAWARHAAQPISA